MTAKALFQSRLVISATIGFVFLVAANSSSQGFETPPEVWEGGPRAKVFFGDANRDGRVDLDDLVQLGASWADDEARSLFGVRRTSLLSDIQQNWRKEDVPELLNDLAEAALLTPFVGAAPSREALYVGGSKSDTWDKDYKVALEAFEESKNVAPLGFEQLGWGVDLTTNNPVPVFKGNQIFKSPSEFSNAQRRELFPNQTFNRLRGGFDESGEGGARYNLPVDETTDLITYVDSFASALDAYGVDVNVKAKSGLWTGNFSLGIDKKKFTEDKSHTIVARSTRSFGWEFASDDVIQYDFNDPSVGHLTTTFKNDLKQAIQDETVQREFLNKYGSHYVFAQHMAAELFIEFNFSTRTSSDRSSVKSSLEVGFNTAVSSVDGSVAYNSVTETIQGGSKGSVTVQVFGGPLEIDFPDDEGNMQRRSIISFLASEIANGASPERVGNIVAAWDAELLAQVNSGAVVGRPIDFLYRPMTDFFGFEPNPFSVQKSLRDWMFRFLEAEEALVRRNEYVTRTEDKFTEAYTFFERSKPIGPGETFRGFTSPLEYTVAVRRETEAFYKNLLDTGRRLYQSTADDDFTTNPIFLAALLTNKVPEFELRRPRLRITDDVSQARTTRAQFGQIAPDARVDCRIGSNVIPPGADCPTGTAIFVGVPIGPAQGLPEFAQGCASTEVRMRVTLDNYDLIASGDTPRYVVRSFFEPVLGYADPEDHPASLETGRNKGRRFLPVEGVDNLWDFSFKAGSIGCTDNPGAWAIWDQWIDEDYPGLVFYLFDTQTGTIIDFYCAERGKCLPSEVDALFEAASIPNK